MIAAIRSLLLMVVLFVLATVPANAAGRRVPVPLADHHMHIQSALVVAWMHEMEAKIPAAFEGINRDLFRVRDGPEALRELDRAHIRRGVLLSTGYMFALPGMGLEPDQVAARMRAENRFNVDAALASKGRLLAFVGINPFAPNAMEELAYWSRQRGAWGVKLHLGNSSFDPANAEQVAKLGDFFAAASKARMPLVIHLRGAAPFTSEGIANIVDKILPRAGDLPIQIAHGGSYGGVSQSGLDIIAAFGRAISRKAPGTSRLVFDLSGVAQLDLSKLSIRDPAEKRNYDELRQVFVTEMRQIGLDRFVLGSDWPALSPPAKYFADERAALPVTAEEWAKLCTNVAPYLRGDWRSGLTRQ